MKQNREASVVVQCRAVYRCAARMELYVIARTEAKRPVDTPRLHALVKELDLQIETLKQLRRSDDESAV